MKALIRGWCRQAAIGCVLILGLCAVAEAQTTHSITVDVDETTAGDLSLIADFMSYAAPGSEVSKSLRRIVMAAVGEITLATNARVDEVGVLTLDDGSIVALGEGDTIQAGRPNGIGPVFECRKVGQSHCRPVAVCHPTADGTVISMPIPPTHNGPPELGACKSGF